MKYFRFLTLIFVPLVALASDELPGDSIYQVGGSWQNQETEFIGLPDLMGKRQVVTMIYTHCGHVCPVIVSSMKSIENNLPEQKLEDTGFVLITFTPQTDTPEVMKAFANQHHLNLGRWTLLRGDPDQIRTVAMALGVKYEQLDNNELNHSNLISVLDRQGRLTYQGSGAPSDSNKILEHILAN